MILQTAFEDSGFPAGYFIVRSVATGKLLDVREDDFEDGTDIGLWPEKDKSLVESFRDPGTNNQVFFIDTSSALCSRSSGHAVDVEGDRLVLRHRRPVSLPFPNAYSHPLPRFTYSAQTGEIAMQFNSDPAYPPPGAPTSQAWREKTFLLMSVPLRKPKTMIDNAAEFITSNIFTPISLLTGASAPPPARPDELFDADIDLTEEEIVDEEKGEEGEVDDSPELGRKVKIITVPTEEKKMMDLLLSEKARNRRRWVVTPLRTKQAKTVSP